MLHARFAPRGVASGTSAKGRVKQWLPHFSRGRNTAIVAHGLTKERHGPASDLERALSRKRALEALDRMHSSSALHSSRRSRQTELRAVVNCRPIVDAAPLRCIEAIGAIR
jgi:hypothetical protein